MNGDDTKASNLKAPLRSARTKKNVQMGPDSTGQNSSRAKFHSKAELQRTQTNVRNNKGGGDDLKGGDALNSAPSADTNQITGSSPKTHEAAEPRQGQQRKQQVTNEDTSGNVKVFCRFRPLNKRELATTGNKICC
jgi:hypothetical protein